MNIHNNYKNISKSFEKELNKRIKDSEKGGVLCINLDNLHMIIGGYGEDSCESLVGGLLKEITKQYQNDDLIIRSDKNIIYIITFDCTKECLYSKASKLYDLIRSYGITRSPLPIQFKCTLGSAEFPQDSNKITDLFNKSYTAFNNALASHKKYVSFSENPTNPEQLKNLMVKASYIQNSFLQNKLKLAFQPIVNGKTGDIAYYECLLRIIDEEGNAISAGPFIPAVESLGFIDLIDRIVLNMAVKELKNYPDLTLSINVSNASMQNNAWIEVAQDLLSDKSVASRAIIEVTETSQQYDDKRAFEFVTILKNLGCKIALDDFGTGYTSFAQLKNLPIDIIKIDGMFVKDIATNKENRFFVETLLNFSKNFNLKTVAEFVENKEIADILLEIDIDYMQGNYFSPAVTYRNWLD